MKYEEFGPNLHYKKFQSISTAISPTYSARNCQQFAKLHVKTLQNELRFMPYVKNLAPIYSTRNSDQLTQITAQEIANNLPNSVLKPSKMSSDPSEI